MLEAGQKVRLPYQGETVTGTVTEGPFYKQHYRVEHPHGAGRVERLIARSELKPVEE